jgi:hypothetical protein
MNDRHPALAATAQAVLFLTTALCFPPRLHADGGFIGNYLRDVYEPSQRGLLQFDPARGIEDLILQGEYEGDTDNFGWIVPVPTLPTLATADARVFSECAELTKIVVRERGDGFGCISGHDSRRGATAPGSSVDVYDSRRVGIYRTLILGAHDASALSDSLTAWGFLHEGNREQVVPTLQFYVAKAWFFVALRTDSASVSDQPAGAIRRGALQPIRLTFASTAPVYPMRISALSARNTSQVLLYVCAPHRMTFPGANVEYANALSEGELRSLRQDFPRLGAVIPGPCFLTKLRAHFTAQEMTADLVLERAPDDEEFREIHYTGIPIPEMLFLPLAWVACRRFRRRSGPVPPSAAE